MNHIRLLRFERMEPRIVLAANASDLLADLQAAIATGATDPQSILQTIAKFNESRVHASGTQTAPPAPPAADYGDEPIVHFRVDIRDLQDQAVDAVQAGHQYVANVFVQDTRELTIGDRINGGVFQAWVDLQFSENLRPTGELRLNEAFTSREMPTEFDGTSFRNLGGVKRGFIPFGGDEQFLLAAPFIVGSTDVPTRIQVFPSTSQVEGVLLYGLNDIIPSEYITSAAFDLPSATNTDFGNITRPPVVETPIGSLTTPPDVTHPTIASPNPGRDTHTPTAGDGSLRLISFVPAYQRDDSAARMKWREEDDWFGPRRSADGKNRDDGWAELELPDESAQPVAPSEQDESDSDHAEQSETDSRHAGLFYDETLFLEGALVETFQSKFRLHLQVFAPQRQPHDKPTESIANQKLAPERDGFIDIAKILTPNQATRPWQENVDEVIAANPDSPSPTHHAPTIDWGTIQPLLSPAIDQQQKSQADAKRQHPDEGTPLALNQSSESQPQ